MFDLTSSPLGQAKDGAHVAASGPHVAASGDAPPVDQVPGTSGREPRWPARKAGGAERPR